MIFSISYTFLSITAYVIVLTSSIIVLSNPYDFYPR